MRHILEQSVQIVQDQILHGGKEAVMACFEVMRSTFGDRLAHLIQVRKAEGAFRSEAELARELGIQERRLNHYKARSEPDFEMLTRLCEALGTHPNYLLGWSEDVAPRYLETVSKLSSLEAEIAALRKTVRAFMSVGHPVKSER